MPNSEGTADATGQFNTNAVTRNLQNERPNKARRRRVSTGQRRTDQQRRGQYITDGECDSASALPRSSNTRRTRKNHRNNSAHHLQEDYYYEDELVFHAVRERDEIYDELELEMALSLSLSLEDSTLNSGNPDYRNQSVSNMSYEVQATMVIQRDKMRRFLRDGHATFYYYELKHGYQWRRTLDDFRIFELVCNQLNKEIRDKGNSRKEELAMLMQIQEHKSIVWMEGPLGWTAWVDIHHDVLS